MLAGSGTETVGGGVGLVIVPLPAPMIMFCRAGVPTPIPRTGIWPTLLKVS